MKKLLAALALIGIVGGATYYNYKVRQNTTPVAVQPADDSLKSGPTVTVTTARREFSHQSVTLTGIFKSDQQANLSTKVPQKILSILVHEGDKVKQGDTLVTFDTSDSGVGKQSANAGVDTAIANLHKAEEGRAARITEMDGHTADAEAGLRTANIKLKQAQLAAQLSNSSSDSDAERAKLAIHQAELALEQAKISEEQASRTLERLEFLFRNKGVPRVEVEGARTQMRIADSQRRAAETGLIQARSAGAPAFAAANLRPGVAQADIEAALSGVDQAEKALVLSRRSRKDAIRIADRDIEAAAAAVKQAKVGVTQAGIQSGSRSLTAPFSGVVTSVIGHAGEFAQPGQPIITLSGSGNFYLEASSPVRTANLLKPGQAAEVTLESLPNTLLEAAVEQVLPVTDLEGRSVPVRIRCETRREILPGSAGKAVIEIATDPKAVTLPLDAVRNEGNNNYVFVVENGIANRRPVTLGAMEGQFTQVISGIKAGETIVVSGPTSLQSGTKVRPIGL